MAKRNTTWDLDEATHIWRLNGVIIPEVTDVLRVLGFDDYMGKPGHAAELGTVVHEATTLLEMPKMFLGKRINKIYPLDWSKLHEEVRPYAEAYYKFLCEQPWQTRRIEHQTVATLNGMPYGMMVDRIGRWRHNAAILDIKTGEPEIRRVGVQTAGYALGLPSMISSRWPVRFCLILQKDAGYWLEPLPDVDDFGTFRMGLALTHWRLRNKIYGRALERYAKLT